MPDEKDVQTFGRGEPRCGFGSKPRLCVEGHSHQKGSSGFRQLLYHRLMDLSGCRVQG